MIPEFPLPPNEADFYHSKLYERPPLFGVFTQFELPEFRTASTTEIASNPIDLLRPLKMAAIRARPSLPIMTRTFSKPSFISRLTAVAGPLAIA